MHRSLIAKKNQQKRDNIMHISSAVFFFCFNSSHRNTCTPVVTRKAKKHAIVNSTLLAVSSTKKARKYFKHNLMIKFPQDTTAVAFPTNLV